MNVCEDLVDNLITHAVTFSRLSLKKKIDLKSKQPTPELLMIKKDGKFTRHFHKNWYNNYKWLTGSAKRNKMFCFYCLLFSNNDSEWCKTGIGEESLKNFSAKAKKHECSAQHIHAAVKFKQIGKSRIDHALSGSTRLAALKHNQKVDQNRLIVSRLISTACFLARQELAFCGRDESETSLNKGNYLETLDFLAEEESHIKNHLILDSVFKGTSSDIQNELIQCVTDVVNEQILNEVENSIYVSVQVDETVDVSTETKMSVILRYANLLTGNIEERFVGFFDVSANKSAEGLASVLLQVLEKWKIDPNKLVSQTYDGPSTMAGKTDGVHTIIKRTHPHALFIHCHAHQLNLVLLHASKTIKQVKLFVAKLTGFRSFFSRSSKRSDLLRQKGFKLPHPSETGWNFHSRAVDTIIEHYFEIRTALADVLENDGWDSNSISQAIGLRNILKDPKFLFLLQLYSRIFVYTSVLFDILQTNSVDIKQCNSEIENCLNCIKHLRTEETIDACIENAKNLLGSPVDEEVEESEEEEERKAHTKFNSIIKQLRVLAYEILDSVTVNLETRFQDFKELDFVEILNEKRFDFYNTTHNFPDKMLENLIRLYPFFDKTKLKGELLYVYGSEDKYVPPNELFKLLINNELKDVLPEVVKLLSLVLSIPATTSSCEKSMSTLKRIKTYLRKTMTNTELSNLSTLAIEKGMVKESATRKEFVSRVIDVFAEKNERRIELIYKKI